MSQKLTKEQHELPIQLSGSSPVRDGDRIRIVADASTRSSSAPGVHPGHLSEVSVASDRYPSDAGEASGGGLEDEGYPWSHLDPHARARNKGSYSTTLRLNDYDAVRLRYAAIKEERNQQQLIRIAIRKEVARILGSSEF